MFLLGEMPLGDLVIRTTLRAVGGDWADWGNAAVNESLTATKTVGVWASCLSLRKRWISPPLKAPLGCPSRASLPAHRPQCLVMAGLTRSVVCSGI